MMDIIWGNIFGLRKKTGEVVHDILKNVPLFEGLAPSEIARIRDLMHIREYRQGEPIFRQGDPGFGMYIIEKGTVSIRYEPEGRVVAELKDGEFFGELALLATLPRMVSAVATAPSRLYGFFHSDLKSLIEHNPRMGVKLALRLAAVIGERLAIANDKVYALQSELEEMVKKYEPL